MAKLQELKDFDTGKRPATRRLSLAPSAGDQGASSLEVPPPIDRGLSADMLDAWISESGPPPASGSQPVVIEPGSSVRRSLPAAPIVEQEVPFVRRRHRARVRKARLVAGFELLVCLALWSVLAIWIASTVQRTTGLALPWPDMLDTVTALHTRGVDQASDWLGRLLAWLE